jgi:hypothetical protein
VTALRTEFPFVLPRGYVDNNGTLHRRGTMRLATAMDDIAPLRDPRVRQNHAYLTIILLARVVTHLGSLPMIDTGVIEGMFTSDIAFLQELYRRKNSPPEALPEEGQVQCPACGEEFVPPQAEEEVEPEAVLAGARLGE